MTTCRHPLYRYSSFLCFVLKFLDEWAMPFIEEYDNETFWDELIERLVDKDVMNRYGVETIRKMRMEAKRNEYL